MIAKSKHIPSFPSNRGEKYPIEILTPDEVKAILAKCSKRCPTGLRNRALLIMLYRGALRISEALNLQPKDVDVDAGTVTVLCGKGGKRRVVGIDAIAMAAVEMWLAKRKDLGFNGRHPLFCTLAGNPVQGIYVRQLLKRLADKLGIAKRCHPHQLRHTCASEMRSEGIDIAVISKHLGHGSIATTSRYLDHLCPTAVLEAVQAREWTE